MPLWINVDALADNKALLNGAFIRRIRQFPYIQYCMTPQLKFVCWFTGLQKPTGSDGPVDVLDLRKKSESASRLGTMIFDKKVNVMQTSDGSAAGDSRNITAAATSASVPNL